MDKKEYFKKLDHKILKTKSRTLFSLKGTGSIIRETVALPLIEIDMSQVFGEAGPGQTCLCVSVV